MKTGNYAKQNRPQEPAPRPRKPVTEEQRRRRAARIRKQKQRQRMLILTTALLAVVVAVLLCLVIFSGSDALKGTWTIDGVTTYAFYGGRKGAMILPSAEYEFQYAIKDDTVQIDFAYEGARDAEYVFSVQGDTLTLTGGSGASQGTYTLTKIS